MVKLQEERENTSSEFANSDIVNYYEMPIPRVAHTAFALSVLIFSRPTREQRQQYHYSQILLSQN